MAVMLRPSALLLSLSLLALNVNGAHDEGKMAVEAVLNAGLADDFTSMVDVITQEDGMKPYMATALLEGSNQVPDPVSTNVTADFTLAIGMNNSAWWLGVGGIQKMTMAHIHIGDSTTAGPVGALLAPGGTEADLESGNLPMYMPPISGAIVIMGTFPTPEGLKERAMNGTAYVNVHTEAAPAGLIRGQLMPMEM